MKLSNGNSTHYLFPKRQILDSSTLKVCVNDNFKFDENGVKFSKMLENTVGKGEIALTRKRIELQTCKNNGLFGNC